MSDPLKVRELPPGRGSDTCLPGSAWTCQIQCDPGTRSAIERLFNSPGAEVCAVTQCRCEVIQPQTETLNGSVQDISGIPLAIVIFGIEFLVKGAR